MNCKFKFSAYGTLCPDALSNLNASFKIVLASKMVDLRQRYLALVQRTIFLYRISFGQSSDQIRTAKRSKNCNSIRHQKPRTMSSPQWLAVCHRHRFRPHSFQRLCRRRTSNRPKNHTVPNQRRSYWVAHQNCTQIAQCQYNRTKCP